MNSQTITDKILLHIQDAIFDIPYESYSTCVMVDKKFGAFLLQFYVGYTENIKDYIDASRTNPEEYNSAFKPLDISEVVIYINNEPQELTDDHYQLITQTLYWKIIHKS